MFLFKYKCINCKYNISLRVNFYYRLTFLLKFKNAVNTIVRYFMHIFSPPSLWAVVFSSFKLLQMTSQSLNTVYQIDFSVLFLTVLVFFVSCFTVSQYHGRHIIINVSRSKCEYFVFSVFDGGVYFSWYYIVDLMRWMDGVYSLLCKTMSVSSSWERCIYYLSLLNNWSNMSFETEVFLYRSNQL